MNSRAAKRKLLSALTVTALLSMARHIPDGVFNAILIYYDVKTPVARWSKELLEKKERGIKILKHNVMSDMELERTGKSEFFPKADDGWIEIALLDIAR